MSFTVTTEPREDRQLAVTIEVSKDRIERELRKAATKLAGQYPIPGFRKGKAPYHIVMRQVGRPKLYGEFVDELGQELFKQAIEQENIQPYAQAAIEDVNLEPLTYHLLVPLDPEIKLGDYHSLRLEESEVAVDETEMERQLEAYRARYAGWHNVDRPAQYGDMITIDVKSVIIPEEGEEDAPETVVLDETDWDVTPDEENPMEPAGFEAELLGLQAGDEKEFVLGWPAEGQSIYAGKQARFSVKLKAVQAYDLPKLDDDFARLVGPEFATLDDLKQSIRANIEAVAKNRVENEFAGKVLDAVVEISELDYPPVVIEDQIDSMLQNTDQQLRQVGIDGLDSLLRRTNQSRQEYREQIRPEATKLARRNLVLSELVKTENLEAGDEEIEARIAVMAGVGEGKEETAASQATVDFLRQGAGRAVVVSQLLTEKAIARLLAIVRGEAVDSEGAGTTASNENAAETTAVAIPAAGAETSVENSEA